MRGVTLRYKPISEDQHLADRPAQLVSALKNDGVDPRVDAHQLEVQVRVSVKDECPVPAESVLAAHGPAALRNHSQRGR